MVSRTDPAPRLILQLRQAPTTVSLERPMIQGDGGLEMGLAACPNCHNGVSEGARFCPQCGSDLTASRDGDPVSPVAPHVSAPAPTIALPAAQSPGQPAATSALPAFKFEALRWSTADRISGSATVVLFISLFLPWFGVSSFGYTVTASGLSSHGFLIIVLLLSLAILVYLVARAGWDRLPIGIRLAHAPVMLVATAINLSLVLIGVLLKPGGSGLGWAFGSFVALIAAVVAVAPIAIPALKERNSRR